MDHPVHKPIHTIDTHSTIFMPLSTPRSFRLVKLLKLTTHGGQPRTTEPLIGFRMRNFDLNQCPQFTALSYTWENPLSSSIDGTEYDEDPYLSEENDHRLVLRHVIAGQ